MLTQVKESLRNRLRMQKICCEDGDPNFPDESPLSIRCMKCEFDIVPLICRGTELKPIMQTLPRVLGAWGTSKYLVLPPTECILDDR